MMKDDLSWILNHLGEEREHYQGAVVPPVYQSSMFCFDSVAELRSAVADELNNPFYTRGHNPTVDILRRKLAALEGAEDALMFGSGSAAVAAAVIANVSHGDHVICVQKPYSWTRGLLADLLPRFGVKTTFIDATEIENFHAALTAQTRMVVVESPNSMTFEMQDLAAVAEFARSKHLVSLCDNSYSSPLKQSPLALGIDLVAHSATKYLNGHSDVVAGAVCGSSEAIRRIFKGPYMTLGAVLSPHDAWLLIRGLRTLPLRIRHVSETTVEVIEAVQDHPRIRRIFYPGGNGDAQAELAQRQMLGATGMFSLELDCDIAGVEVFCDALQRFLLTCSWGGYESLALPICGFFQGGNYPPDSLLPPTLVRISLGLEPADVLIADLLQALDKI